MEFIGDSCIHKSDLKRFKWCWVRLCVIHASYKHGAFNIIDFVKNEYFISLFSAKEIDKLIEILSRAKEHEAVAYVMDYKARKYGFRQNGEDDLL